jgi:hypothetical protein
MRRITSFALSVFGLLAVLPASLADADSGYWGAIWYRSSTDHAPIWNLSSKVAAIRYIQDKYGDDANRVVYPSGWCGALISYTDYSGRGWLATGTGKRTRDAALEDVDNRTAFERDGQYKILEAECQD